MEQLDNHHRSKKLKKEIGRSTFDLLPEEIKLDILSRVSCVDTLLECKRVRKNWQTLLRDPCFRPMHSRHTKLLQLHEQQGNDRHQFSSASKMCFLFGCYSEYIFGEYDVNDEQNFNKTIMRSKPIPETIGGNYVGSYDGLVLSQPLNYSETDPLTTPRYDALVVSNPMTREYVNLPSFLEPIVHGSMMFGFGYDSSTGVYKVIRIFYPPNPKTAGGGSVAGQVYIYTLGRRSSGWRHAGIINNYLKRDRGVLANGALHWLEKNNGRIFAFDLAEENFREFAAPPGLDYRYTGGSKFILRSMGGCLCLQHKNSDFRTTEIWALKKETIENYSSDRHEAWNWTKEFCIVNSPMTSYFPLDVTKTGELLLLRRQCSITEEEYNERLANLMMLDGDINDDEAASLDNFYYQSLVRFNPKTEALEEICDTVVDLTAEARFVKSLVSLKDLGEEDAKRM